MIKMNEEEIQKALEIIKQPITVNCIEYKYFDQENYDKLISVYDNCLWFIRNFEQINTTVERVQQENKILRENAEHNDKVVDKVNWENQQLKEKYRIRSEAYDKILLENADLKDKIEQQTKVCLADHKYASSKEDEVIVLTHERDLYKSVIDEIREYVENNVPITHYSFNGILEILDKAKENK